MNDVISKICLIPRNLRTEKESNLIPLVQESGYLFNEHLVTNEKIMRYLKSHPYLIKDWLLYSENKRTSEGWYFDKEGKIWKVGYFKIDPGHDYRENESHFRSRYKACTFFIINEINELRKIALRDIL